MLRRVSLLSGFLLLSFAVSGQEPVPDVPPEIGPARGWLVIAGGGLRDRAIIEKFIDLAGGTDAPIVVIPTASGEPEYGPYWSDLKQWRDAGATNLTVLHTYDRTVADTDEFVKPIRAARGVWFGAIADVLVEGDSFGREAVEVRRADPVVAIGAQPPSRAPV